MADQKKPNIVMIMADDVGTWNLSAYGPLPPRPDMNAAAAVNMEDVDPELFLWHNSTRCHAWTPPSSKVAGRQRIRLLRRRDDGAGLGGRIPRAMVAKWW
jgi:hypothetical protein